ncbi:josephin domain-containing protein [Sporobolomyces salmoneus]|uniref:josephin domain-containing protein n=1 Tax=Sporobolomyces salmoneus TaxID=183962 RepID=UPI00317E0631
MSDLVGYIYHEKQEPGSMMCLQHSINNLLQSELFSPASLADIARELDQLESAQLDPGTRLQGEFGSQNVDESGFFSVQVAEKALEVLGLRLVRWGSEELAHVHNKPEQIEAFLFNHQHHWFSLRRFAPNRFYNLDSCIPEPTWVSEMYLGLQLREFELRGYSIFAIVPSAESMTGGLPSCDASTIAPSLPSPSGSGGGGAASSLASGSGSGSHTRFNGSGQTLGGNGAASSSNGFSHPFASGLNPTLNRTYSKGKRPASDEDEDDDDVIIEEGQGQKSVSAGSSSVEEESELRRRRRKIHNENMTSNGNGIGGDGGGGGGGNPLQEMSEEDMMARAIEESLRVSRLEGESNTSQAASVSGSEPAKSRSKAADAEEEEFQRALQASLAGAGDQAGEEGSNDAMEEEEEDAPTMEQLRARRLARFG